MGSGVCPGTEDERAFLLIKWKVSDVDFTDAFDLSWRIPGVFSVVFYDNFGVKVVYCSGLANTNTKERNRKTILKDNL